MSEPRLQRYGPWDAGDVDTEEGGEYVLYNAAAQIISTLRMALAHYARRRWESTAIAGGHGEPRATVWYLQGMGVSYTALGDQEPWRVAEEAVAAAEGIDPDKEST